MSGLSNVTQLASTVSLYCALHGSGAVTCFDELGTLTPVLELDSVRQIAGGVNFFCAVRRDDSLWCWGANDVAQLGTGARSDTINTPSQATQFRDVAEVALGLRHNCVRFRAGGVSCVGRLPGLGQFTNLTPVPVPGWEIATKIVAGSGHLCAILNNGLVQCIGSTPGAGVSATDGIPLTILLPSGTIDVGASANNGCVLMSDSSVYCWGGNSSGELGISPGPDSMQPIRVPVPAP